MHKITSSGIPDLQSRFLPTDHTEKSGPLAESAKPSAAQTGEVLQRIQELEQDCHHLDETEKKALAPTLDMVHESVEVLNNLALDDNGLLNGESLIALKDMQAALLIREIRLPAQQKSIRQSSSQKFVFDADKKFENIRSALSHTALDILKKDQAEKTSLIKSHGAQLTKTELHVIIESMKAKEAASNIKNPAAQHPVSPATKEIHTARVVVTNTIKEIFAADEKAIATMNLEDSLRKTQIANLSLSIENLEAAKSALATMSDKDIPEGKEDGWLGISKAQVSALQKTVEAKLEIIKHIKANYDAYRSPKSVKNICQAKQIEISAAIAVLKDQPTTEATNKLIRHLEARIEKLNHPDKSLDSARLLGKKRIKRLGNLLHPLDSARQTVNLERTANRLMKKDSTTSPHDLETHYFTEKMLMQRLLEKSGVKNAKLCLNDKISKELNTRPWTEITSEFYVPAAIGENTAPVKVVSITTPAGAVMNDAGRFKPLSDKAPLNQQSCEDYLTHQLADANNPQKKTTGGFNSHDTTETRHAVTAAHTDCTIGDHKLFGGTRSGVNAAFDLTQAHLLELPVAQSAQIIQSLISPAQQAPTALAIRFDDNKPASQGARAATGNASAPALIDNPIQLAIREEVRRILTDPVLGKALLTEMDLHPRQIQDFPDGLAHALDQIMAQPARLVSLVEKSKPLCELLGRQAALNRAREVLVLEIARDPQFLTKIERGEPILFSSVSLLTPDHLRDILHRKFGMSGSSNEKRMLATQLQAWKDLQKEIDNGGVVINGIALKAKILTFNFGVNQGGVGLASHPVIGELVSGWEEVNHAINETAMEELRKSADAFIEDKKSALKKKLFHRNYFQNPELENDIKKLSDDIRVVDTLNTHITNIWRDGSYRTAGNEPYKLPARVAMLSFVLGGGTTFNCKSGKDRTGQLDVEVKFLAFQTYIGGGVVPEPDRALTPLEKQQLQAFVFQDKSRTVVQQQNTGYVGSKLDFGPVLSRVGNKMEGETFKGGSPHTRS